MRPARWMGVASLVLGLALFVNHDPTGSIPSSAPADPSPRAVDRHLASPNQQSGFLAARATSPEREAVDAGEALYWSDRVLVSIDVDLVAEVSERHGLDVLRVSEAHGLARLAVPSGRTITDVLDALADDPSVNRAFAAGKLVGAKKKDKKGAPDGTPGNRPEQPTPKAFQWHLEGSGVEASAPVEEVAAYRDVTVAVLDSGVAYEAYADDMGQYAQARSLAHTPIVAPMDFVNGDTHANDDHQHGTHIASVILSQGEVSGVAPGATLMPVKVLDEHNQGDEMALIEGIHHAIDHGADIINMSLSFGGGFIPSAELLHALARAEKSGVVMVAAAGNAGLEEVSWPAASPGVLSVGAVSPTNKKGEVKEAPYSNLGGVDVMAPGGNHGKDKNGDGFDDGVLAETFAPNQPMQLGYWFQSGTSQAAAFVTGAAVQLLAAGAAPDQVRAALHLGSSIEDLGGVPYGDGMGAGVLNVEAAIAQFQLGDLPQVADLHVSVMPYIEAAAGELRPWSQFMVVTSDGEPAGGVRVHARADGSSDGRFACTTASDGTCDAMGELILGTPDTPAVWTWTVEMLEVGGLGAPPSGVLFASDELEVLLAAVENEQALRGGLFAVHWPAGPDPELGNLAEAYTVPDAGTGLLSSPLGLVFTPAALGPHTLTITSADLNGTGLLSSPLGMVSMRRLTISQAGLSFGMQAALGGEVTLVAADGSGLLSSPLGFSPLSMFRPMPSFLGGSGLLSSPLGLAGRPIFLNARFGANAGFVGSSIGDVLGEGGWTLDSGLPAATALFGSGLVDDPAVEELSTGASAELPGERLVMP